MYQIWCIGILWYWYYSYVSVILTLILLCRYIMILDTFLYHDTHHDTCITNTPQHWSKLHRKFCEYLPTLTKFGGLVTHPKDECKERTKAYSNWKKISVKSESKAHTSHANSYAIHDSKIWPIKVIHDLSIFRQKLIMIRWLCELTVKQWNKCSSGNCWN